MGITNGQSAKIYETYREAGGNFIDTAKLRAPMIGIAGTVLMPQSCERYLGHAATNLF
jgi:aryl-alcohol dehydrogenase-like predicted oxidoreductase